MSDVILRLQYFCSSCEEWWVLVEMTIFLLFIYVVIIKTCINNHGKRKSNIHRY